MSLTVGAIVGGIGSAISNIGQGALTIIRIIAIVGFATIFSHSFRLSRFVIN